MLEAKVYIVVEVSDRNHHLCKKQMGKDDRYTSLMNGRSRFMVAKTCDMLNEQAEHERVVQEAQEEQERINTVYQTEQERINTVYKDKTYTELVEIAKKHGIKKPGNWANSIITTRQAA